MSEPRFFKMQKEWRAWLEKNHAKATELVVGFHKAKSGNTGNSYKEALDEALRFGWIDAVRRGGEATWTIRFAPRNPRSIWSQVNIKRMEELKAMGMVHPAGLAAYQGRNPRQQKKYSFENRDAALSSSEQKTFRAKRPRGQTSRRCRRPIAALRSGGWSAPSRRPPARAASLPASPTLALAKR